MRRADGLMLSAVGFDMRSIEDEPDVRRERKRSVRCPAGQAAVVRKPCPDALRGDTCGRQYRVAVLGILVADPEQDVLCADAIATASAGLLRARANTVRAFSSNRSIMMTRASPGPLA